MRQEVSISRLPAERFQVQVVVATKDSQLAMLDELQSRGQANGLTGVTRITSQVIRRIV